MKGMVIKNKSEWQMYEQHVEQGNVELVQHAERLVIGNLPPASSISMTTNTEGTIGVFKAFSLK
jgi:hypothetical protein